MGTKYTTQTQIGYNASPPSDDAAQTASNKITWAFLLSKVGNPIKTLAEAINSALVTAFDTSCRTITTSDATVAGDHLRTVQIGTTATTGVTVTLMDAVSAVNGYIVTITNQSPHTQTVGRVTASNTINTTTNTVSIVTLESITFIVNAAASGYIILSRGSDAAMPKTGGTFTGNVLFTDNTYDIGASGATRPRHLWLSGNASAAGGNFTTLTATTSLAVNSTSFTVDGSGNTVVAGTLGVGASTSTGLSGQIFSVLKASDFPQIILERTVDGGANKWGSTISTGGAYLLRDYTGGINAITVNKATGNVDFVGTVFNMAASGTTLTVGVGANNGTVSAGVFTDRTKYPVGGDALAELSAIKGKNGHIDHDTLPVFMRANVKRDITKDVQSKDTDGKTITVKQKVGEETVVERDLGATISMLTVAIGQLLQRIEALEKGKP